MWSGWVASKMPCASVMYRQVCKMWLHGDRRVGPKPIGAVHRKECKFLPCAPLIKKRPWALEMVVRHAPHDTHKQGGPQWAAHAIRQIGDGKPRTLAEKAMVDAHPDVGTPHVSVAPSEAAMSEAGDVERGGVDASGEGEGDAEKGCYARMDGSA